MHMEGFKDMATDVRSTKDTMTGSENGEAGITTLTIDPSNPNRN